MRIVLPWQFLMLFKYLKRLKHPFSNKNSIIDKKNTITLLRNYNCEFFLLSNISVDDQAPNAQIYFMNHITKTTQWEDPRKVNAPQNGSRAWLWLWGFFCVLWIRCRFCSFGSVSGSVRAWIWCLPLIRIRIRLWMGSNFYLYITKCIPSCKS